MVEIGRVRAKAGNAPIEQKISAYPQGRFPVGLSTVKHALLNMTTVFASSGSVLVFLLTAKRFL
jgi:hypothetical protein